MLNITFKDVLDTARKIAAERPDYVYTGTDGVHSYYVHGNAPGCLVGHILDRLGVDLGHLRRSEGVAAGSLLRQLALDGIIQMNIDHLSTMHFLRELQIDQDGGMPWGAAVRNAEKYVSEDYMNG